MGTIAPMASMVLLAPIAPIASIAPIVLIASLGSVACGPPAVRRFPARALRRVDDDRRPLSRPPATFRRGRAAQVIAHQMAEPVDRWLRVGSPSAARNVNARGEVPDSTWFTHHRPDRLRDTAALRRGAARTTGPSLLGAWQVIRGGEDAAGPFLVIQDESGQRFLLRFDAPGHPRLATTASLVSTLLLHAVGYRVPERHLVIFLPSQLRLSEASRLARAPLLSDPGTRLSRGQGRGRNKRRLRHRDLRRLLGSLPRLRDKSLRAVATRLPAGQFLGPFRWRGTRPGDPNDFVDHARRRELRGLLPVAAWLNLTGITAEVPQDLYLRSTRHVRHLLWGLRGALGSTRRGRPKPPWEGFANILSLRRLLAQAATLGSLRRRWVGLKRRRRRLLERWPGLGWLPRRGFRVERWAPRLSNAAFTAADPGDLHWGARRLAAVPPAAVGAVVRGAYLPPAEAERLAGVLLHRRREALRTWLSLRAPLGRVRWDAGTRRLCAVDLWQREGLGEGSPARPAYETRVRAGADLTPGAPRVHRSDTPEICLVLPSLSRLRRRWGRYLVIELRRPDVSHHWLRIHLRVAGGRVQIAGIER